jgi:hypothetical protein
VIRIQRDVTEQEMSDEARVRTNCLRERRRLVMNLRVRRVIAGRTFGFESAMVGAGRVTDVGDGEDEKVWYTKVVEVLSGRWKTLWWRWLWVQTYIPAVSWASFWIRCARREHFGWKARIIPGTNAGG